MHVTVIVRIEDREVEFLDREVAGPAPEIEGRAIGWESRWGAPWRRPG